MLTAAGLQIQPNCVHNRVTWEKYSSRISCNQTPHGTNVICRTNKLVRRFLFYIARVGNEYNILWSSAERCPYVRIQMHAVKFPPRVGGKIPLFFGLPRSNENRVVRWWDIVPYFVVETRLIASLQNP